LIAIRSYQPLDSLPDTSGVRATGANASRFSMLTLILGTVAGRSFAGLARRAGYCGERAKSNIRAAFH
jgi:hypothetical protein